MGPNIQLRMAFAPPFPSQRIPFLLPRLAAHISDFQRFARGATLGSASKSAYSTTGPALVGPFSFRPQRAGQPEMVNLPPAPTRPTWQKLIGRRAAIVRPLIGKVDLGDALSSGVDPMRIFAVLFVLGLALVGSQAHAEPAGSESPGSGQVVAEAPGILVLAQAGAERIVRQAPAGLTDAQIYGIAVGIVAGALAADLAGLNGLGTLALAAVGGALGNWLLSAPIAEAALTADEPDEVPDSRPPNPTR
jgi:hypothetical protein